MSENERRLVSTLTRPGAGPPLGPSDTDASAPSASGHGSQTAKPGRRRRAAESTNTPPKNQHFYFVDQNSSSKEKRAHVMRHHVQEKRKQRKMSHSTTPTEHIPDYISYPAKKEAETAEKTGLESRSTAAPNFTNGETSLQIRFSNMKPQPHAPALPPIGSPITILDASRRDPFSSLPMEYDNSDIELADYWRNKLMYWSGQNLHLKNQIFRTAMGHPLSFKAVVLSYCARWKAQLYGMSDSTEIQRHVGQAAKIIDDITSGSVLVRADDLAMALGGMALHEGRFGSKELAQIYVNRAVQVMRPRTGSNKPVEVFIHYIRYLMMPEGPDISFTEQQWLLTFLRGAEDLMRQHSSPEYLLEAPHRLTAFQMEGPLFSLLSSGPRPSQVPHESRVYVVRDAHTQEVSRTAALIYITAALWDFQNSPNKTDRFLQFLSTTTKQHHLDRDPACETLLWLLLEEAHDSDLQDPERGWSTGELVKAHKRLRPDLQFQFNEILMSFLSFQTPIRGVNAFEEELRNSLHNSQ
ncbi:hypothetical protein DTO013E5_5959 [Penicillium roqueforti]|uniref:Genomic scaffold, ProqFM164S01 n=1 Tax=Penicillium roqueforti (strain FM164) TaxID=1365484 RepID=W6Q001_PENRF|nr:uncharacterized protein LCP9604111_7363 [Penicillium roqueforti]CDM29266.1 unnamed protein product [Penicillium roqueforti FM164]KAF9244410.1 hypothetical protein LCP9604111_7363 [Penicillium roqueforti]KAI2678379.1 hypothetical protein LCP963914a_7810 [Penicillium roqueforti]KAI2683013.1 hypothetical protein CBS147355_2153 [Penicillium roqueforti]KAI2701581.1 hypothetical protein CBS147372_4634 [Penicillium roqueforti]